MKRKHFFCVMVLLFLVPALVVVFNPVGGDLDVCAEVFAQTEETKNGNPEYDSDKHPTELKEDEAREARPKIGEVKEEIEEKEEKLGIHGGVVILYQGAAAGKIEGRNTGDAGEGTIAADLSLSYRPGFEFPGKGRFFFRIHAADGAGADKQLGTKLFANLNSIADDNEATEDNLHGAVSLCEAYYAHEFWDGRLAFFIGKTEPLIFLDDNESANDSYSQFVGKPFVNNPALDGEDEYTPLMAVTVSPSDQFSLSVVAASSTRPHALKEQQKSIYSHPFDDPFVGAQFAYSPKFGELRGNYRVYFWDATYDHTDVESGDRGWGVGLSFDQEITKRLGLFARLGYHSPDVYEADFFWSLGASLKGMIPCREEDRLGIGVAGLKGNGDFAHDGTEFHSEIYYRIHLTEHFAVTPDIQFVANPLGNDSNDPIFAGMIRGEFTF